MDLSADANDATGEIARFRRIGMVVNPCSSGYEAHREAIATFAQAHNVELVESDSRQAALEQIKKFMSDGVDLVIAAGGDGTINAAAQAVAELGGETPPLAVLPLGTGNDVCRNLGLSLEPQEAMRVIETAAEARSRCVDLLRAEVDGQVMFAVNMVSVGNSPRWVAEADRNEKATYGSFAYLRESLRMTLEARPYAFRMWVDDAEYTDFACFNVVIANGPAGGGGFIVAPNARPDDGLADVVIYGGERVAELIRVIAEFAEMQLEKARPLDATMIQERSAREVRIESDEPLPVSIDGDVTECHKLSVTVLPSALCVLSPPPEETNLGESA